MSRKRVWRASHLLWLFAYPVYQVVGTFRHEASHALAAVLQGARITDFVFLPSNHADLGFMWGYVRWIGETTWMVRAMPYFCDLLTFLGFFIICMFVIFRWRWIWLNLVILGLASPLINSAYNYLGGLKSENDIGRLLIALTPWIVHTYFICTCCMYAVGIILIFRQARSVQQWKLTG